MFHVTAPQSCALQSEKEWNCLLYLILMLTDSFLFIHTISLLSIPSLFCTFPLPYTVSWRWSSLVLRLDSPSVCPSNVGTVLFTCLHSYGLWSAFLACMHPASGSCCITSSVKLMGPCRYHRQWQEDEKSWRPPLRLKSFSLLPQESSLIFLYSIFKSCFR